MYLYELTTDPDLIKLVAATDQLQMALDTKQITEPWPIETLLKYFREFNLVFSKENLYNMVQTKPLKNVIRNIDNNMVMFKGLPGEPKQTASPPPEQSKEVVKQMAKSAMAK